MRARRDPGGRGENLEANTEARRHGGRTEDVTEPARDREVRRIVEEVQSIGVLMAAAESSVSLARAAADFNLTPHSAIDEVRRRMVESGEE